ncbi:hypothetical protein EVA_16642, partial [gut metagenome]
TKTNPGTVFLYTVPGLFTLKK